MEFEGRVIEDTKRKIKDKVIEVKKRKEGLEGAI